jgi:release factor glutamine methyltransferase
MEGIHDQFDIIVTNPPYVAEPDMEFLDREIRLFEPHLALSGGPDGVAAYRLIAKESITRLKTAGILVVEIGINQAQSIRDIFVQNGLKIIKTQRDFSNIDRCILATVGHSSIISEIKV